MKIMSRAFSFFAVICILISIISCKNNDNNEGLEQAGSDMQQLETGEKPIDLEAEKLAAKYGSKSAFTVAQLKRGIAFAESNSVEKLIDILKNPADPRRKNFVSGDYYIWIFKTDFKSNAIVVAHPINKAIENRDFFEIKDADGKLFMKDIVRIALYKGEGWVSYKWAHPKTLKAEDKLTYFYRMGDYILNDGFYLKD